MNDNIREEIRDIVLTEEEKEKLELDSQEEHWYDYQEDVLNTKAKQIAFVGARQTGKTELVKEWALENDACIVTSTYRDADMICRISRTFDKMRVYAANQMEGRDWKHLFCNHAVAFDNASHIDFPSSIMSIIDDYKGKVLMVGTDVGSELTAFNEYCMDKNTIVIGASMDNCPNIYEEQINEYRENMSAKRVIQEVNGDFVIDPEEL